MSKGQGLTRRAVLSGVAAAGAGALLGPGVARAGSLPGPGVVRAAAGPDARSPDARSPGGRLLTHELGTVTAGAVREIAPARPVCLAAVRFSTPAHADVELRARRGDGSWGPWGAASCVGHEGDGVRSGARVGEGIWTGPTTALQLRSATTVRGVAVLCVPVDAVAASDAPPGPALTAPSLPAGPGQPPIIARREWAGASHPPVAGPFYGTVEMGVVHHTENPNGYSAGDVPAMLRAIYEFHVHGRGWFDIGYNYVIDRFGRIWEARQGGVDLPVIGAQAGDWNEISFGVSMLGTFAEILPSDAALASLQRLLAWKMALSGVPVTGEITAVVAADGVSWTQFGIGEHVHFPRIAGHRQVDATSCPGDVFFGHLPDVRARAAALAGAPARLGLRAELSTFVGRTSTLALDGRLADGTGRPIAGAPVQIQSVVGRFGDIRGLTTAMTDENGAWTASVVARAGMLVRALHAAVPAVTSQLVAVGRSTSGGELG
jgi:hypothetical protein